MAQAEKIGRFPVISDEEDDQGVGNEGLGQPGVPFQKDWRIKEEETDETVGLVHVQLTKSHKDLDDQERIVAHVVFEFTDEDGEGNKHVLVASGSLPFRDPPDWFDSGKLAYVGGTGPYKGLSKNVKVEVTNPKRWSIGGP